MPLLEITTHGESTHGSQPDRGAPPEDDLGVVCRRFTGEPETGAAFGSTKRAAI